MNIFFLDRDPRRCAEMHNDKHVVKMILEYAQLLSTAHRILDGVQSVGVSASGRKATRYVLQDSRDAVLYKATHVNHPSAKWARDSVANYSWLYNLFAELCKEYTRRYGRAHLTEQKLSGVLASPPDNMDSFKFRDPPPAMPEIYKEDSAVESYRNYYFGDKQKMAKWKTRETPRWFTERLLYGFLTTEHIISH